jgi:hypothetical protein
MRSRPMSLILVLPVALALAFILHAQTADQRRAAEARVAPATPDLSGVWTQYPRISGRSGRTSYTFSKHEPPMTPWAEAKYKAAKAPHVGGYRGVGNDPTLGCFPPGVPRIYLFNFPMEIFQIPGRVILFYEFGHYVRQIFTDGRGHKKGIIYLTPLRFSLTRVRDSSTLNP